MSLSDIIKEMNKRAKEDVVQIGITDYKYKRIPFSSPRMNYCTFGGLPVGKITEFYGEPHGGKTTTAFDIIANYQKSEDERKVLFIDCENALDVEWANKIGVDTDDMVVFKPTNQSAESILQFILDSIETGEVGLWVLDSIGALVSEQELEKTVEEKTYAGIAKSLTVFARKAEMLMQKYNCTGIGINQVRENINSPYGGITTPGGKAWKHFCCCRFEFRQGSYLDEKGNAISRSCENPSGNIVMMSMVKNKSCPPTRRTGSYTLNYYYGIDWLKDLIDVCVKYDIINKRGAWFDIIDIETGEVLKGNIHGQAEVVQFLGEEENKEILERIKELVSKAMSE